MQLDRPMHVPLNYPQFPQEQLFAECGNFPSTPRTPMSRKPLPAWPVVTGDQGYCHPTIRNRFFSGEHLVPNVHVTTVNAAAVNVSTFDRKLHRLPAAVGRVQLPACS